MYTEIYYAVWYIDRKWVMTHTHRERGRDRERERQRETESIVELIVMYKISKMPVISGRYGRCREELWVRLLILSEWDGELRRI